MITNKIPESIYFRLYPTFMEASEALLKSVNKHAFYRFSIWKGNEAIAQMIQGISPVILADKIILSNAQISFNNDTNSDDLSIKLQQHYGSLDEQLGMAKLTLNNAIKSYIQLHQRYFSLQQCTLVTNMGNIRLIYSLFVEENKYQLDVYIRKFKEHERQMLKAKRNISAHKRAMQRKMEELDKKISYPVNGTLSQIRQESGIERTNIREENNQNQEKKIAVQDQSRGMKESGHLKVAGQRPRDQTNYLQINSAAKFHLKEVDKNINKIKSALNELQQKELHAYSSMVESYQQSGMFPFDVGLTTSVVSDGSEQSQMIANKMEETYSEKAVKKFKHNISQCVHIIVVIIALILIYIVIAPSKRFTKPERIQKKFSKIADDLSDL